MLEELKVVRGLLQRGMRGWVLIAIFGSCLLAGLDTLGVAAMLPLMQLLTGANVNDGVLAWIASTIGDTRSEVLILVVASTVAIAFVIKSVITTCFRWWLLGHATSMEAEASTELMRRYVLSSYASHRTRNTSEVFRNISSAVPQTFGQVVLGLIGILADVLTLVAVLCVLLAVSPMATAFTGVFFFLLGWGFQRVLKKRHTQIGTTIAQADLDTWAALMPGIDGFRELRLTSSAETFVTRFRRAKFERASASRALSMASELPRYVLEAGFVVGIAGIAALLFATGTAESALSVLGVFAAAATRLMPTMNRVIATIGIIRAGRSGLSILAKEVTALKSAGMHSEQRRLDNKFAGDICISSMSFVYSDSDDPVLHRVSTVIEAGKTTAFVGSSGAGKSTLMDVLLGLLEPTEGAVTCGGRNILDDLPTWYSSLGVVPQDVYLLDATLAENIAFGSTLDDFEPERVMEAIELAQLSSLISDLPDGLQTRVGERGVRLSGGQRQRVGIARALYRRPRVLVLDEATSALDNETERKISETIDALSGSMTIILVAHRLSTVKNADKVVFMSSGKVEAEGTFTQLQDLSTEFSRLVALGKLS